MVVYRNLCPSISIIKIINPTTNNPQLMILSGCPMNHQLYAKIGCFGKSRHPTILMEM
jgi:hypothetical protein